MLDRDDQKQLVIYILTGQLSAGDLFPSYLANIFARSNQSSMLPMRLAKRFQKECSGSEWFAQLSSVAFSGAGSCYNFATELADMPAENEDSQFFASIGYALEYALAQEPMASRNSLFRAVQLIQAGVESFLDKKSQRQTRAYCCYRNLEKIEPSLIKYMDPRRNPGLTFTLGPRAFDTPNHEKYANDLSFKTFLQELYGKQQPYYQYSDLPNIRNDEIYLNQLKKLIGKYLDWLEEENLSSDISQTKRQFGAFISYVTNRSNYYNQQGVHFPLIKEMLEIIVFELRSGKHDLNMRNIQINYLNEQIQQCAFGVMATLHEIFIALRASHSVLERTSRFRKELNNLLVTRHVKNQHISVTQGLIDDCPAGQSLMHPGQYPHVNFEFNNLVCHKGWDTHKFTGNDSSRSRLYITSPVRQWFERAYISEYYAGLLSCINQDIEKFQKGIEQYLDKKFPSAENDATKQNIKTLLSPLISAFNLSDSEIFDFPSKESDVEQDNAEENPDYEYLLVSTDFFKAIPYYVYRLFERDDIITPQTNVKNLSPTAEILSIFDDIVDFSFRERYYNSYAEKWNLIFSGAALDDRGNSALYLAIQNRDRFSNELLAVLISQSVFVSGLNYDDKSALQLATEKNDDVAKLLLSNQHIAKTIAAIHDYTINPITQTDWESITQQCINGQDKWDKTLFNETILTYAIKKKCQPLVEALTDYIGIDLGSNSKKENPEDLAAQYFPASEQKIKNNIRLNKVLVNINLANKLMMQDDLDKNAMEMIDNILSDAEENLQRSDRNVLSEKLKLECDKILLNTALADINLAYKSIQCSDISLEKKIEKVDKLIDRARSIIDSIGSKEYIQRLGLQPKYHQYLSLLKLLNYKKARVADPRKTYSRFASFLAKFSDACTRQGKLQACDKIFKEVMQQAHYIPQCGLFSLPKAEQNGRLKEVCQEIVQLQLCQ